MARKPGSKTPAKPTPAAKKATTSTDRATSSTKKATTSTKAVPPSKTKEEQNKAEKPPGYTPKKEAFVQAYMICRNKAEAYRRAYAAKNMSPQTIWNNAHVLSKDRYVAVRIAEEEARAAKKHGVTVDRLVAEYAKIGFSDIRNVVKWKTAKAVSDGEPITDPDGNVVELNQVTLVDSDLLEPEVAAAIAEISQTKDGALRVKLHDKKGALDSLAKHLGMFKEAETPTITLTLHEKLRRAIKQRRGGAEASSD